jgi:hypothetical protein
MSAMDKPMSLTDWVYPRSVHRSALEWWRAALGCVGLVPVLARRRCVDDFVRKLGCRSDGRGSQARMSCASPCTLLDELASLMHRVRELDPCRYAQNIIRIAYVSGVGRSARVALRALDKLSARIDERRSRRWRAALCLPGPQRVAPTSDPWLAPHELKGAIARLDAQLTRRAGAARALCADPEGRRLVDAALSALGELLSLMEERGAVPIPTRVSSPNGFGFTEAEEEWIRFRNTA